MNRRFMVEIEAVKPVETVENHGKQLINAGFEARNLLKTSPETIGKPMEPCGKNKRKPNPESFIFPKVL